MRRRLCVTGAVFIVLKGRDGVAGAKIRDIGIGQVGE